MTTNTSSDGTSISICCYHRDGDPETKCHWNVSFSIVPIIRETNISEIVDLNALLPSNWVPCASNITCYSYLDSVDNDSMYLLDNGEIFMKEAVDRHRACGLEVGDYCFNFDQPVNGTESLVNTCKSFFDWLISREYVDTYTVDNTISSSDLCYIIAICISLPFIIATFVIYMILPELNNLPGFILRNYMISCFVVDMTLMLTFGRFIPSGICNPFLGITQHFSILSTFFWLNVMSFDMWWTFRMMEDSRKQSSRRKKIYYSIYAWGSSLLIIAVGLIIDYVPHLPEGLIKPGLKDGCWLLSHLSFMVYSEYPMAVSFITNIFFFASTAIIIFRQRNASAQHLEGSDSRRHDTEKYRFYIYLKLLILTGMQWFSEIVEIVWNDPDNIATFILDLPHLLQGLTLFIIFVWNDRIKRSLSAHLGLQYQSIRQWIGLNNL